MLPSGTVHWIGSGLSTGSGLKVAADHAGRLVLWARTAAKAEQRLARYGLSGRALPRRFDPSALAAELTAGDVVVSMLPASEHAGLLGLCIAHGAHFACASYVSEPLLAVAEPAAEAGLIILTEAGLDPGIDHLLAHQLVAHALDAVGDGPATAEFTSYCGGLPAVPNEFRYRFSWAPLGVLTALCAPARYISEGAAKTVDRPWEATFRDVIGGETFEVYPNRDSLPFVAQYGFPASWQPRTFLRGTLRLAGWHEAWQPVFAELCRGDADRISELARTLAARYPMTGADHDRVVLAVALTVTAPGGGAWSGEYLLDLTGDDQEAAMARCVSLPLAFGVTEILAGAIPAGLHRAAGDAAERWLAFLAGQGIDCQFRTTG